MKTVPLILALFSTLAIQSTIATFHYDQTRAQKGVYYSGASYCAYETLKQWSCGTPCSWVPDITSTNQIVNTLRNTFVYTTYNRLDNEVIVVFRGTNGKDYMNWLTNSWGFKVEYEKGGNPNVKVHSGFKAAYDAVKDQMLRDVMQQINEHSSASVFVTGHSLGGALAVLAALDIKKAIGSRKIHLYTYGQPRVGNSDFADYVFSLLSGDQYIRVVHYDDAIPHLPP